MEEGCIAVGNEHADTVISETRAATMVARS